MPSFMLVILTNRYSKLMNWAGSFLEIKKVLDQQGIFSLPMLGSQGAAVSIKET